MSFDKIKLYESDTIEPGCGSDPGYVLIRGLWWELSRFEVLKEKEGTE